MYLLALCSTPLSISLFSSLRPHFVFFFSFPPLRRFVLPDSGHRLTVAHPPTKSSIHHFDFASKVRDKQSSKQTRKEGRKERENEACDPWARSLLTVDQASPSSSIVPFFPPCPRLRTTSLCVCMCIPGPPHVLAPGHGYGFLREQKKKIKTNRLPMKRPRLVPPFLSSAPSRRKEPSEDGLTLFPSPPPPVFIHFNK